MSGIKEGVEQFRDYEKEVLDYIKKVASDEDGNVRFEFALGTHIHYDHIGNFEAIFSDKNITADKVFLKEFDVETATELEAEGWDNKQTYEKILSVLEKRNISVISDLPNEEFTFGDFTLKFINTVTPEEVNGNGENASSVGVIVKKGAKTAFLGADFTGDSGLEKIYGNDIGDVDLLKIGHHGYFGSSSASFLRTVKPEIAICTNKIGKIYPNVKWNLTMVAKAPIFSTEHRNGIIAYFTDNNEIVLTSDIM